MKKIICFVAIALAFISNACAQTLGGSYCEYFDYIAEHDSRYAFDIHGNFDYQFWDDVEDKFGSGSYLIRNDSLILNFESIPKELRTTQIISEISNKEVSTFMLVNPVSSSPNWACSYQVLEGDSILLQGKSDFYGRFEIRLEETQTLKVYAHFFNPFHSFTDPIQLEINGQSQQKDYVIVATGIKHYGQTIPTHSRGYPFKLKERSQRFGIKVNNKWIWYKTCKKN